MGGELRAEGVTIFGGRSGGDFIRGGTARNTGGT
jgi:hypothetical protein